MSTTRIASAVSLFIAICATVNPARAQVGGAVTGTSIGVSTISTGTVLQVNPAVSADRRYVGMSINPQFSTLEGVDTFVLGSASGSAGGVVGNGRAAQAVAIKKPAFRPAVVGRVTFVDRDKPLLAASVKPMAIKGASLKDAVRKLSDATRMNLVLGGRGLEQAGVDLTTAHDFVLGKAGEKGTLTMKEALLALVQTAMPEADLVITSEDRVITVESQAQADKVLVTKTYYLQDLFSNMPRIVAGGTDLNHLEGPAGEAAGGGGEGHEGGGKAKGAAKPTSTNILEVITSTVRPEIWINHGGKADIFLVNDKVTVKAPASVHALLEGPKTYNPNKVNSYVTYGQ